MYASFRPLFLILFPIILAGQPLATRQDSLRGSLTSLRTCYDVSWVDLDIRVDPAEKSISGTCTTRMRIMADHSQFQMDLAAGLDILDIRDERRKALKFEREGDAVFIQWRKPREKGEYASVAIRYGGHPVEARNPPWDGGFSWKKDPEGRPWVAVSCQGLGASAWWPCKDHQSDEPDSMRIAITVPPGLEEVSNGRLTGQRENADGWTTWVWKVRNPINTYNVTLNIGNYQHFNDLYHSIDGDTLTLDYFVLPENLNKARAQFQQVGPMLECFETHFGPYPFPEDGYKLVETPYLGMEHQSAVAYGNQYRNGTRGRSSSEEGMWFDYIIVHESAHEWFGNSITSRDIGDMWIHESFASYMEAVYVECLYGYEAAGRYMAAKKKEVLNDRPVVGPYGVNQPGSRDMYPKGALMLHTLRHVVGDDDLWWTALRSLALRFRHQIVTYDQIVDHLNQALGEDYTLFFDEYLHHTSVPRLELRVDRSRGQHFLRYRLTGVNAGLTMPVRILIDGTPARVDASSAWGHLQLPAEGRPGIQVDPNWYLDVVD